MFEYEGQQYTEEEVKKAAKEKNLPIEDYIKQFEITPIEEPSLTLQNLMPSVSYPTPGKKKPTTPGAVVEETIAPTITEPPLEDISLESLDTDVKTGTSANTVISKERNIEEEERIFEEYNKIEPRIIKNNPNYTPEQIKSNADDEKRLLLEGIDSFDQQMLFNKRTNIKNDIVLRIEENEVFAKNNVDSMSEIKKQIEFIREQGDAEGEEELVNNYNNILKQTKELEQNIIKDAGLVQDENEFLDTFRRSYSEIDRLSNAVQTAGTDLLLGGILTLDMLKSQEGKDASVSKDLLKYREELGRIAEQDLGKAIAVENIDSPAEALRWGSDALINFTTSGMIAFSGPAAMPLFFASGYGGRLSQFELATRKAEEVIPELEAKLKETKDPQLRKLITDEIEFHNKALSTTDMQKFATSTLYGGYEFGTEWLTTLQLVKGLKGLNGSKALETFYKNAGKETFGKALVTTLKDANVLKTIGTGPLSGVIEGGGETANTMLGNITDIVINDADIGVFDGGLESFAQGKLIGNGFALARGGQITRAFLLDGISNKYQQIENNKMLADIKELTQTLNTTNDPKVRAELHKTIRKKIKESNLQQDYTASAFIKLSPKKQKELFDLDRQANNINKRWIQIANSNTNEKTKTQLRKELLEQFNGIKGKKQKILDNSNSIKLKNITLEEGLVQGDVNRNIKILQTELNAVEQNNKKTKYLNKQVAFDSVDLENIEEFANSNEVTLTLNDGSVINKEDVVEILRIVAEQADGGFNKDTKTSYINLPVAIVANPAAATHEYYHAMSNEKGFTKDQYDDIEEGFKDLLKTKLKNKEITQEQYDTIKNRLKIYDGTNEQSEELQTITGDAISLDILSEDDTTFLQKAGYNIKQFVAGLIGKEESENFGIDSPEDAFNLLKTFKRTTLKNQDINIRANVLDPEKQTDKSKSKTLKSKSTLFDDIQKLVPNNIKTKQEFDNFVRSPQGAKLFNSIYEEGGAINNYIRQRATTPAESQKIIDNTIERVLNFNPESTRDDGGVVGVEGFTERIMADTRFAKLDAKKDLFKESERAKQEQQLDSPQAAQVAATESTPTETTKQQTSKLRRDLGIKQGDDLYNAVKQTAKEIFGKDLDNVELKKLKAIVNKKARGSDIFKDVAKLMGTEKAIDPQFLNKNILNILKDLPVSDLVKLERGTKGQKIFTKTGPRLGPIAAREAVNDGLLPKNTNINSGPRVSEKLPVTLEQAKEFFTQKRKAGLVGVIAENLISDAAPSVTKEIKTAPKRRAEVLDVIDRDPGLKFSISVGTQNILSRAQFDLGIKDVNALLNNYKLSSVFTVKTVEDIPKYIEALKEYVFPLLPKQAFFGPSGGTAFTSSSKILGNNFGSLKDADGNTIYENGKPKQNPVWAEFTKQIKALKNDGSIKFGEPVISKEADVELFKIKSYKTLFNTPVNIKKNIDNGEIAKFNEKVSLIHKTLWERIDKSIRDNKQSAPAIATYLRITGNDTGHWHKQGANFVGYSTNPKGKDGTLYEYEHAMPATAAYMYLLDVSLSDGNFKPAYNAVMDNYKLIALDKAENAKLGKAKLSRGMPKGWELGKNFWWQRYFNPEVAAIEGGIPPNSIMMDNGRLMGDQLGVGVMGERTTETIQASKKLAAKFNDKILPPIDKLKGNFTNQQVLDKMAEVDNKNVSEELKFSKSIDLNKDMNDLIQAKTGIASEKTYSRVKAEVVGANKGRFDFFIPPSAEDFTGLLYKTLSKSKLGDSQMAWYKAHLINPYSRAMDNISRDRVALQNDFKALKKELKGVPKTLKKKVPGEGFTQEQAVRSYIWDKQGMTIPGLAGTDIKTLVDFVAKNPDLVTFADQLIAMQKGDQYAAPGEGWLAGNITTDLMEGINTTKRAKYLEVWQTNADQIFSESNLNKLEAAYGKDYRVALENSLQRMKTGKNRSFGGDSLTGRVTDWLTNSIGAIMFFNTRSAVLQTISAINFINFGDNNVYAAGKAFANQPQYWKDFKTLFNSDFLLERRDGLKLNVNEADIADMAKRGGVRGVISELLRLGFLPTQLADSFAIAAGGSTFYRNRLKALEKQGMNTKDAEVQAFQDFRETAEESQQSSRPDRISQQQAGPLGRVILAFANTPAQYARIIKKAASDLKNRRGDDKTNVSKILYYGVAQNLIFNALQQALFGLAFGDEEEPDDKKEKRYVNVANGMADSLLRGMGLGGAVFSVLKNTALRLNQESDKKSPKYQDVLVKEILQISPPISSKVGKLRAAGRSYSWNKEEMMTKGWSIDNPAYLAAGQVIAATTNIPLDRAFKKIDNIRNASNSDLEAWQRVASAAGWSAWELGIKKGKNSNVKLTDEQKLIKLTKKQQVDSLLTLGISKKQINKLKLESDRVQAILNPKSIKKEKVSKKDSLFGLNKKQQVNALLKLGFSKKEIRALKLESDRVSTIMSKKE